MAIRVQAVQGPYVASVGERVDFRAVGFDKRAPKPVELSKISWRVMRGSTLLLEQHHMGPAFSFFVPPAWGGMKLRVVGFVNQASRGVSADLQVEAYDAVGALKGAEAGAISASGVVQTPKVVEVVTDITTFEQGKKVYATVDGDQYYVGYMNSYPDAGDAPPRYRGLARLKQKGDPIFDAVAGRAQFGVWADIASIVAQAESNGSLLALNAYDRTHFTFGHMQWSVHEPNANFALIFRELLKLPTAAAWFPDLTLAPEGRLGKITQLTATGPVNLELPETVKWDGWWKKDGVWKTGPKSGKLNKRLMEYLNSDPRAIDVAEVTNSVKFIAWTSTDPAARRVIEDFTVRDMRKAFDGYKFIKDLDGKSAAVCTLVYETQHQGRGEVDIAAALAKPDPYKVMLEAGLASSFKTRVKTIDAGVTAALADPVFKESVYDRASRTFVRKPPAVA